MVIAAGAAVLLAVTGCSGSSEESGETGQDDAAGNVFEFQTNGIEPADEVTVSIPDDLRKAMGTDADALVINQIVATAHKVDGVEHCAADLAITYGTDQPKTLLSAGSEAAQEDSREQVLVDNTDRASSLDEVVAAVDEMIAGGRDRGASPDDIAFSIKAQTGIHPMYYREGDTGQDLVDRYLADQEETTDADIIGQALDLTESAGDAHTQSDFDDSAPEVGTYVSDDHATVTVVRDCAASPTDPENNIDLVLPTLDAEGGTDPAAEVQLSVMTDGTIGVRGEVDGYTRDSSGNWIAG